MGEQRHVPGPPRDGRRAPAIYKPVRGERPLWDFEPGLHRREVAAYRLSEAMGIGAVPPTVLRDDGPLGEGSVQWFVDADHREHYFTIAEQRPDLHDQLRAVALLDIVANNTDRKSGHCLLAGDRVWAIDNGLCFAPDFKLRTVIWEFAGEALTPDQLGRRRGAGRGGAAGGGRADHPGGGRGAATAGRVARRARRAARRRDRRSLPLAAGLMAGDDDDEVLDGLIHRADLDGLVRLVDDCCASRDWARLRRLRDRARHAVGTGSQLWPAATLAEYRLALLAPAPWAAGVLDEGSGRFTIGPLTEVVAQHHTWRELAPLLDPGPRAALVAHERALAGRGGRPGVGRRAPRRPRAAVPRRRVGAGVPAGGVPRRRRRVPLPRRAADRSTT